MSRRTQLSGVILFNRAEVLIEIPHDLGQLGAAEISVESVVGMEIGEGPPQVLEVAPLFHPVRELAVNLPA